MPFLDMRKTRFLALRSQLGHSHEQIRGPGSERGGTIRERANWPPWIKKGIRMSQLVERGMHHFFSVSGLVTPESGLRLVWLGRGPACQGPGKGRELNIEGLQSTLAIPLAAPVGELDGENIARVSKHQRQPVESASPMRASKQRSRPSPATRFRSPCPGRRGTLLKRALARLWRKG
ncbi:hypothetical protein BGZ61DRAFT_445974 [Ilyonectria robusta]|uniref:uncharacterized protein n=1 Tax=Ilyonectria robusta TaxID=1079257 RepID=UPI001E8CF606|nr:uncharacterized protein BGZ61DRAFT_445974 [Ilyonectria robusta]KAH8729200.1 hypothetical protein BGZ61DRAFT_445974 [Ilyonectria robusta]